MAKQVRRNIGDDPFAMFHLGIELRMSGKTQDGVDDVVYRVAPGQIPSYGSAALATLFDTLADDVASMRELERTEDFGTHDDLSGPDIERAYRVLAQMVRRNVDDDGFGYGQELQDFTVRRALEPLRVR